MKYTNYKLSPFSCILNSVDDIASCLSIFITMLSFDRLIINKKLNNYKTMHAFIVNVYFLTYIY